MADIDLLDPDTEPVTLEEGDDSLAVTPTDDDCDE